MLLLLLQAHRSNEALCVASEEPVEGLLYLLAQQSCPVPAGFHHTGILASLVGKYMFCSLSTSLFVLKYNFKGITCCLIVKSHSTIYFKGKLLATL